MLNFPLSPLFRWAVLCCGVTLLILPTRAGAQVPLTDSRLLDIGYLKATGQWDNTLLVFLSDKDDSARFRLSPAKD